jgi:hypothetical protein
MRPKREALCFWHASIDFCLWFEGILCRTNACPLAREISRLPQAACAPDAGLSMGP